LLGEILANGLADTTTASLIATVIELDVMQAQQLPKLWKQADEASADCIFAIEAAWLALRDEWLTTRELLKQLDAKMSEAKAEHGLNRQELKDRLVEVDTLLGGPTTRERLAERLRELAGAHESLPMIGRCNTCGHVVST
jgi:hypothetical protein